MTVLLLMILMTYFHCHRGINRIKCYRLISYHYDINRRHLIDRQVSIAILVCQHSTCTYCSFEYIAFNTAYIDIGRSGITVKKI